MKTTGRPQSKNIQDLRAYFGTDSVTGATNLKDYQPIYDQVFQKGPLPAYKTPSGFSPSDPVGDIIKSVK